jgi:hypothetical protein
VTKALFFLLEENRRYEWNTDDADNARKKGPSDGFSRTI